MADKTSTPVAADAAKSVEETTRPVDAASEPAVEGAKPTNGDSVAPTDDAVEADPTLDEPTATDAKADDATGEEAAVKESVRSRLIGSIDTTLANSANGTPASKKGGNNRRKSGAGIPEHKKKTPSKKKKVTAELQLNVQPGETRFVAMRGYQPWPVIVCDEEMLPEILLCKRPVSAKRIDGTYREDFMEGGKNAKDRRFPVMFLGTNEFAWQVNTELQPFDLDEVKKEVAAGNTTKKSKALWQAYEIAAKGHDLDYFKAMLNDHDKALQDELEKMAVESEEEVKPEKKTGKRKSIAAEESDDIDMEDVDGDAAPSAKKAKASKKRKKDAESDGEQEKACLSFRTILLHSLIFIQPAKTPKTKLKLNNTKTPKEASAAKPKKEAKPKKTPKAKSVSQEAEPVVEEKPLTDAERIEKREKSVLYLRHRLQKGFLSRDQAPKEEEMDNMSDYLKQLEGHQDLEAEVIKKTKVHKVLKAIIKLNSIPKEDEYQFKKRSNELLSKWGGALAAEADAPAEAPTVAEPATNGVKHDAQKTDPVKAEATPLEPVTKAADGGGDVDMAEDEATPAVNAESGSSAEVAVSDASAV
ncbi:hypothetical protein K504DRAFT_383308 [Pleomassaria siparia CBS 279.74]|uniref:PWWP domain-containing protein n=1 Tax=Pleomassaria siparia CBS 279.74 TaxID=1314801 RepID=A0A6G1K4G6_9PLEO|nr:hypothetical protein K504DRAFT_383308 [Pleomassaria siparia CBS 279.74]